jgi:hypothetical protein
VTTFQNGNPLTITDTNSGGIYGFTGNGAVENAQFCPGMGVANLATSGSLYQRVVSGLNGGHGMLNGSAPSSMPNCSGNAVLGKEPMIGGATDFGNMGPGVNVLGPGQQDWDISIFKTTKVGGIREDATLQFRTEFYNAFNHPNFALPVTNAASGAFGQVSASSVNPRLIQFALKYAF